MSIFHHAYGLTSEDKKLHPYVLIGDDYGVLSADDLDITPYVEGGPTFFTGDEPNRDRRYWQCVQRDRVSIKYEDYGYSAEELGYEDTFSNLTITVTERPGVFHQYGMRRLWPADAYEKRLHLWRQMLKHEPYVCLEGDFGWREKRIAEDGIEREYYLWTFEKIKTKHECDSYFDPCVNSP